MRVGLGEDSTSVDGPRGRMSLSLRLLLTDLSTYKNSHLSLPHQQLCRTLCVHNRGQEARPTNLGSSCAGDELPTASSRRYVTLKALYPLCNLATNIACSSACRRHVLGISCMKGIRTTIIFPRPREEVHLQNCTNSHTGWHDKTL